MGGCGGGGPIGGKVELAEASGTVTFQGSPLAGASVQALPKSGPLATGVTDAQGNFTLSTGAEKGVAVGPIKVAIRPAMAATAANPAMAVDASNPLSSTDAMRKYQEQQGSSRTPPKPEETGIPAIYLNADTSGIKFDIKAGEANELKIDLK
jgi:hypothetical protein